MEGLVAWNKVEGLWDWRTQKFKEPKLSGEGVTVADSWWEWSLWCQSRMFSFSFGGAYLESKVAVSELDIWVPGNEKTKEKGHSIE